MVCGGTAFNSPRQAGERGFRTVERCPGCWLKRNQFFAGGGEHVAAMLRNHHHVLNANTPSTRDVSAWLNRDYHARSENLLLTGSDPWGLMDLNSHSMPRGMSKIASQARLFQYISGRTVHFANCDPRLNRPYRRFLRVPNGLVEV